MNYGSTNDDGVKNESLDVVKTALDDECRLRYILEILDWSTRHLGTYVEKPLAYAHNIYNHFLTPQVRMVTFDVKRNFELTAVARTRRAKAVAISTYFERRLRRLRKSILVVSRNMRTEKPLQQKYEQRKVRTMRYESPLTIQHCLNGGRY